MQAALLGKCGPLEPNQLFERMRLDHRGRQIDRTLEQGGRRGFDYTSLLTEALAIAVSTASKPDCAPPASWSRGLAVCLTP